MSIELVRELNALAGCGLEVVEEIHRGQSGAVFVRWPDGRESVVTTAFATIARMEQTAEVLEDVRAQGLPVPRHEFLLEVSPGTVAVVQERLPGRPRSRTDVATVDAAVAVNERFAGLLADRPEVPGPILSLGRPDDPVPAEAVEEHSERARRMVALIRHAGRSGGSMSTRGDLVHVDFTVPNLLFDDAGMITGVVDWNYGVARGDRRYGLVKLLHTLSFAARSDGADAAPTGAALDHLDRLVSKEIPAPLLRRYWAHHTLTMLYSSLRWGTPRAFELHLELGESRLAEGA
ncbi:aminoglycoside phosphotransferase family protein [Microlunatus speluncae]|uniref:aminoglycoside phosphotransferase family protein n=1 Tax=Microlunatus speluncae TaxID=2594267 RepID=UPI001266436C|nr:aminoglycoside phosphotransferase family protein [Microlunatus speluncae]